MTRLFRAAIGLCLLLGLNACSTIPDQNGGHTRSFNLKSVAKSDIDMVADTHAAETFKQLSLLADKLYRRNPREWKHAGLPSREAAVQRIFYPTIPEVQNARSTEAIRLAFEPHYNGDRVLAFVAGLASMMLDAYNGKQDFYLLDSLDAQKLYNSARNMEVAAWLLRSRLRDDGQPFLLSHGKSGEPRNLSFERLFGKIIAQQDTLALVVATRNNRTIKNAIQSAASMVFLPI